MSTEFLCSECEEGCECGLSIIEPAEEWGEPMLCSSWEAEVGHSLYSSASEAGPGL